MLFDDIGRRETRHAYEREGCFSYLNMSARPEARLIRAEIEKWFRHYPEEHRIDFKHVFRSDADLSAFTELLVFSALRKIGAENIKVHQTVENGKKPDFYATINGSNLFVEVKNIETLDNPLILQFYTDLNKSYQTKGFLLDISVEGAISTPISVTKFKRFLDSNFSKIKGEEFPSEPISYSLPRWSFPHENAHIIVTPIPTKYPGKIYQRPIGSYYDYEQGGFVGRSTPLRKKLNEKASRYGNLNQPYIIATNHKDYFIDRIDICDALFGQEVFIYHSDKGDLRPSRKNNGLWSPVKATRVSGVIVLKGATPWSFWARKPELWLNPWAAHPLDITPFHGHFVIYSVDLSDGTLAEEEGETIGEILGLDPDVWK